MAGSGLVIVGAVVGIFAAFAIALAYVNFVAGDKAVTFDQERHAREG